MIDYFFKRLLVVAPHADDEVLGCGGLISRVLSTVDNASVMVIVMGTTDVDYCNGNSVTANQRVTELSNAMYSLSANSRDSSFIQWKVLYPGCELKLDSLSMHQIVSDLDTIVAEFKPTAFLVNYESHHQDHQITYRAAISAMRPSPENKIPLKGLYEYGYLEGWSAGNNIRMPKFYVDISDHIDTKLKAFNAYESQKRTHPADLLSESAVQSIARTRGLECGVEYAEAFFPLSMYI